MVAIKFWRTSRDNKKLLQSNSRLLQVHNHGTQQILHCLTNIGFKRGKIKIQFSEVLWMHTIWSKHTRVTSTFKNVTLACIWKAKANE